MGTVGWVVIVVSHTEGQRSFHWLGGGGWLSLSLSFFSTLKTIHNIGF